MNGTKGRKETTLSVNVFTAPGKAMVGDSPSAIQDTKRYLQDFDRLQKTATSDQELFDQMTALYPDWVANQSWLMFGFPGA